MRRASRVDENQADIVAALRKAGCSVQILSAVGEGCPDLLVARPYYPHHLHLLEVKNPDKPIADQQLTPDQVEYHAKWKGPIFIVKTVGEALETVGIVRFPP